MLFTVRYSVYMTAQRPESWLPRKMDMGGVFLPAHIHFSEFFVPG